MSQNATVFARTASELRTTANTASQINSLARSGTSWANGIRLNGVGWKAEAAGRFARNAFAASEILSKEGMKLGESAAKLSLLIPEANLKAATALAEAQAKATLPRAGARRQGRLQHQRVDREGGIQTG